MTIGAGKYDDVAELVRRETGANSIILVIIGGKRGHGSACRIDQRLAPMIPKLLRDMANEMEEDYKASGLMP